MAPTVMVARIALSQPSAASRVHAISDLAFQTRLHFQSGHSFPSNPDEVQVQGRISSNERKSSEREIK